MMFKTYKCLYFNFIEHIYGPRENNRNPTGKLFNKFLNVTRQMRAVSLFPRKNNVYKKITPAINPIVDTEGQLGMFFLGFGNIK
jgi:hypothetical protein